MNRITICLLVAISVVGCTGRERHIRPQESATTVQRSSASEMMARMSEEEMMDRFQKFGSPSQAHTKLEPLAGTFNTVVKWWKEPGMEPQKSEGKASYQWILGKRFLKSDYKGQFNGQPFQGTGLLGHDNVTGKYISTWADTMSTGLMLSEGDYDPASRSMEMVGKFSCPITEAQMEGRTVTRILDKNRHVFEMYMEGPDGKQFKSMEIVYNRTKS